MAISIEEKLYTIEEVAEKLRVTPAAVRARLILRPREIPPSILIGRRRLFPESRYREWLATLVDSPAGIAVEKERVGRPRAR
ncbi:MAG: helix-turn-helix domain-containing protein [Rhodanobacteraceae bacterium]|nr:helix-turn-helix domain-containing protein [Rhodanobacteraceae bacterium]MBP9155919.1 helix-turn-helix domain-containing protein [Xanthomonadales bacterium]